MWQWTQCYDFQNTSNYICVFIFFFFFNFYDHSENPQTNLKVIGSNLREQKKKKNLPQSLALYGVTCCCWSDVSLRFAVFCCHNLGCFVSFLNHSFFGTNHWLTYWPLKPQAQTISLTECRLTAWQTTICPTTEWLYFMLSRESLEPSRTEQERVMLDGVRPRAGLFSV